MEQVFYRSNYPYPTSKNNPANWSLIQKTAVWFYQQQTTRKKKRCHFYRPNVLHSSFSWFPRILRFQESGESACHCGFCGSRGWLETTVCMLAQKECHEDTCVGSQDLGASHVMSALGRYWLTTFCRMVLISHSLNVPPWLTIIIPRPSMAVLLKSFQYLPHTC